MVADHFMPTLMLKHVRPPNNQMYAFPSNTASLQLSSISQHYFGQPRQSQPLNLFEMRIVTVFLRHQPSIYYYVSASWHFLNRGISCYSTFPIILHFQQLNQLNVLNLFIIYHVWIDWSVVLDEQKHLLVALPFHIYYHVLVLHNLRVVLFCNHLKLNLFQ